MTIHYLWFESMVSTKEILPCVDKCMGTEDTADCFIDCTIGEEPIREAKEWIKIFSKTIEEVIKVYGFTTVLYSKEFGSFIKDPWLHLRKKLFIYTHDLKRGRLSKEEYARKSLAAIRTSLRTNLRTLYQNWVFLSILMKLYEPGTLVIYPEHKVLSLERSGKQKLRWIPPNIVIDVPSIGSLSFYIEAPRPIAWEDTSDLKQAWSLYTALRPDMMVYGGRVMDITDLSSSPPVKKPDIIIECKELIDWYQRIRDVRGPLAKPLTAEEWRSRWIQGLWDGLADVLGVTRKEAIEEVKERKGIRLSEVKIVKLYKSVYNPKEMIVVSRYSVPSDVRKELESYGIKVIDNVGFERSKLSPLIRSLEKYAKESGEFVIKITDRRLAQLISKLIELYEENAINVEELYEYIMHSTKRSKLM